MPLEDDGSQQHAEWAPSYFERRREECLGGLDRKPRCDRAPKSATQPSTTESAKEIAARIAQEGALRRQRAVARRLAKMFPHPEHVEVRVVRAVVDNETKRWPTECSPEIYEYCAYVRVLITSGGVATALGVERHRAMNALSQLRREGLLREAFRLRTRSGSAPIVWEWVGP